MSAIVNNSKHVFMFELIKFNLINRVSDRHSTLKIHSQLFFCFTPIFYQVYYLRAGKESCGGEQPQSSPFFFFFAMDFVCFLHAQLNIV